MSAFEAGTLVAVVMMGAWLVLWRWESLHQHS